MDINLQIVLTVTISALLIAYITKRSKIKVKDGELQFGFWIKVLGVICLVFSVIPFIVLLTENYKVDEAGEAMALIWIAIGFAIAAVYTLAEGLLVKGKYSEEAISFSTPWTGAKKENWEDLMKVSFNRWCCWYELRFKSGKVVRLSPYLGGCGYLLDFLRDSGHDF